MFFFFVCFWPGHNFTQCYEAGFYNQTILKVKPSICRIIGHAANYVNFVNFFNMVYTKEWFFRQWQDSNPLIVGCESSTLTTKPWFLAKKGSTGKKLVDTETSLAWSWSRVSTCWESFYTFQMLTVLVTSRYRSIVIRLLQPQILLKKSFICVNLRRHFYFFPQHEWNSQCEVIFL